MRKILSVSAAVFFAGGALLWGYGAVTAPSPELAKAAVLISLQPAFLAIVMISRVHQAFGRG